MGALKAMIKGIEWSPDKFTPMTLLSSYRGRFPLFIKILEDTDNNNEQQDHIARVNSMVTQDRVVASDHEGRILSFPLDFPVKFEVLDKKHNKYKKKRKSLRSLVKKNNKNIVVRLNHEGRWKFRSGTQQIRPDTLEDLVIRHQYKETFLICNAIKDGKLDRTIELLTLYDGKEFQVGEGLKEGVEGDWASLHRAYTLGIYGIPFHKIKGTNDIIVHNRSVDWSQSQSVSLRSSRPLHILPSTEMQVATVHMNGDTTQRRDTKGQALWVESVRENGAAVLQGEEERQGEDWVDIEADEHMQTESSTEVREETHREREVSVESSENSEIVHIENQANEQRNMEQGTINLLAVDELNQDAVSNESTMVRVGGAGMERDEVFEEAAQDDRGSSDTLTDVHQYRSDRSDTPTDTQQYHSNMQVHQYTQDSETQQYRVETHVTQTQYNVGMSRRRVSDDEDDYRVPQSHIAETQSLNERYDLLHDQHIEEPQRSPHKSLGRREHPRTHVEQRGRRNQDDYREKDTSTTIHKSTVYASGLYADPRMSRANRLSSSTGNLYVPPRQPSHHIREEVYAPLSSVSDGSQVFRSGRPRTHSNDSRSSRGSHSTRMYGTKFYSRDKAATDYGTISPDGVDRVPVFYSMDDIANIDQADNRFVQYSHQEHLRTESRGRTRVSTLPNMPPRHTDYNYDYSKTYHTISPSVASSQELHKSNIYLGPLEEYEYENDHVDSRAPAGYSGHSGEVYVNANQDRAHREQQRSPVQHKRMTREERRQWKTKLVQKEKKTSFGTVDLYEADGLRISINDLDQRRVWSPTSSSSASSLLSPDRQSDMYSNDTYPARTDNNMFSNQPRELRVSQRKQITAEHSNTKDPKGRVVYEGSVTVPIENAPAKQMSQASQNRRDYSPNGGFDSPEEDDDLLEPDFAQQRQSYKSSIQVKDGDFEIEQQGPRNNRRKPQKVRDERQMSPARREYSPPSPPVSRDKDDGRGFQRQMSPDRLNYSPSSPRRLGSDDYNAEYEDDDDTFIQNANRSYYTRDNEYYYHTTGATSGLKPRDQNPEQTRQGTLGAWTTTSSLEYNPKGQGRMDSYQKQLSPPGRKPQAQRYDDDDDTSTLSSGSQPDDAALRVDRNRPNQAASPVRNTPQQLPESPQTKRSNNERRISRIEMTGDDKVKIGEVLRTSVESSSPKRSSIPAQVSPQSKSSSQDPPMSPNTEMRQYFGDIISETRSEAMREMDRLGDGRVQEAQDEVATPPPPAFRDSNNNRASVTSIEEMKKDGRDVTITTQMTAIRDWAPQANKVANIKKSNKPTSNYDDFNAELQKKFEGRQKSYEEPPVSTTSVRSESQVTKQQVQTSTPGKAFNSQASKPPRVQQSPLTINVERSESIQKEHRNNTVVTTKRQSNDYENISNKPAQVTSLRESMVQNKPSKVYPAGPLTTTSSSIQNQPKSPSKKVESSESGNRLSVPQVEIRSKGGSSGRQSQVPSYLRQSGDGPPVDTTLPGQDEIPMDSIHDSIQELDDYLKAQDPDATSQSSFRSGRSGRSARSGSSKYMEHFLFSLNDDKPGQTTFF